jgi:hypothetical protein
MSPEDVPAELVEKAYQAYLDDYAEGVEDSMPAILAAVLPEAMAEAWDEGKEALAAALLPDAAPLINPYREGSTSL